MSAELQNPPSIAVTMSDYPRWELLQDELHKLEKQHREQLANAEKEDERQKSALHDRFARNEVQSPHRRLAFVVVVQA